MIGIEQTNLRTSVENALTIDVEDYFQVSAFEQKIERSEWIHFESRVERNTYRLLELFENARVKATFFVLGWVANKHPRLISDIAKAGHELASHGYWHRLNYNLTRKDFTQDLLQSKTEIECASGTAISAYRAPSFSICKQAMWVLDSLIENEFSIDSSIYPVYHHRYGLPNAMAKPHQVQVQNGRIVEFPPSVWKFGRWTLPVAGGGYFRLYPLSITKRAIAISNKKQQPFMFYLHPWEIDPNQPRISDVSLRKTWRHYVGLQQTEQKLIKLLSSYRFTTLSAALKQYQMHHTLPTVEYVPHHTTGRYQCVSTL